MHAAPAGADPVFLPLSRSSLPSLTLSQPGHPCLSGAPLCSQLPQQPLLKGEPGPSLRGRGQQPSGPPYLRGDRGSRRAASAASGRRRGGQGRAARSGPGTARAAPAGREERGRGCAAGGGRAHLASRALPARSSGAS